MTRDVARDSCGGRVLLRRAGRVRSATRSVPSLSDERNTKKIGLGGRRIAPLAMRLPRTAPLLSTRLFALLVPFPPATGLRVGAHALRAAPPLSRAPRRARRRRARERRRRHVSAGCRAGAAPPAERGDEEDGGVPAEVDVRGVRLPAAAELRGRPHRAAGARRRPRAHQPAGAVQAVPRAEDAGPAARAARGARAGDGRAEGGEAQEAARRAARPPPFPGAAPAADPAAATRAWRSRSRRSTCCAG